MGQLLGDTDLDLTAGSHPPVAAPLRAPLAPPGMPAVTGRLGLRPATSRHSDLVPPSSQPLLPAPGHAPALVPVLDDPQEDTMADDLERATLGLIVADLSVPAPTAPAQPEPGRASTLPEPSSLAAALDAAGAPAAPSEPSELTEGAAAGGGRRLDARRLRLIIAAFVLTAGALGGPSLARWIHGQVIGSETTVEQPAR